MRGRARSFGALLVGALLVSALLVTGAGPATADDVTPVPSPSLSPPSQQQIDDAKAALDRLRGKGTSTPTRLAQVAGPTTEDERPEPSITSRISDEAWWTIGAGLLVLLVASEATRLNARRAKHRKEA